MKKIAQSLIVTLIAIMAIGAAIGVFNAETVSATEPEQVKIIHALGGSPLNVGFDKPYDWEKIRKGLRLTWEETKEAKKLVEEAILDFKAGRQPSNSSVKFIEVTGDGVTVRWDIFLYSGYRQVYFVAPEFSFPEKGIRITLSTGTILEFMKTCGNAGRVPKKPVDTTGWVPPLYINDLDDIPPLLEGPPDEPVLLVGEPPKEERGINCPAEMEIITGAGHWSNALASGNFAYGEGIYWSKRILGCGEWFLGAGVYGTWENGESKLSAYTWDGNSFGPQVGVKWTHFIEDPAPDGTYLMRQFVAKFRYVKETQDGRNSESGYHMSQETDKFGFYGEYVHQPSQRWLLSVIGEGWTGSGGSIESSWSGDTAKDRSNFFAGLYAQYEISDLFSIKAGGGPFYNGWDEMTGVRASAEIRINKMLMLTGGIAAYPFGINKTEYPDHSAADLTTYSVGVRIELEPWLRRFFN